MYEDIKNKDLYFYIGNTHFKNVVFNYCVNISLKLRNLNY